MSKTTATIRFSSTVGPLLEGIADTHTAAAQEAVVAYAYIRRSTWHDLKGRFTKEQAAALADMFNGVIPTPETMASRAMLKACIGDAESLERICSKHGADVDKMLKIVDDMASAEVYVLQAQIARDWETNNIHTVINHLSNA